MKVFEERIFDTLSYLNSFPMTGIFQIEEKHVNDYIEVYGEIFNKKNKGLRGREKNIC